MNYQTFKPHQDLESLVNFYWTLEVSAEENSEKQRIEQNRFAIVL